MSTLSSLISGGGGALPQIALTQSQTWVPPQDGNVCIHVIGAGGSGSATANDAFSGGAGGYCKKNSLAVTTGGSFTVVVGVGGAAVTNAAGIAGGNSTVAGTGLSATLTANGGTAGNNTTNAGGSASNGDVNNTGGSGNPANGGGGAVGVYGAGANGIDAMGGGQSDAAADGIGLSGFGYITGGNAGIYQNINSTSAVVNAGSLSGGGAHYVNGSGNTSSGGNGGIGGGGGGTRAASAGMTRSGKGGDGLVLIQYLPS